MKELMDWYKDYIDFKGINIQESKAEADYDYEFDDEFDYDDEYFGEKYDDYEARVNALYIQGLENPKPNNTSLINKISFNNFKPFGKNIQKFSKKPLTLIYSPNSVGKSSFIHLSAYIRYIFETKSFDLKETDLFGDNIDLGGYTRFVHKRDYNNSIRLGFEFDDCSNEIINYLNLNDVDFSDFDYLETFTFEDIKNIINNSKEYIQDEEKECDKIYKDEFNEFSFDCGASLHDYIHDYDNFSFKDYTEYDDVLDDGYDDACYDMVAMSCKTFSEYEYYNDKLVYYPGLEKDSMKNFKKRNHYMTKDYRNDFISNILIPEYIMTEKYFLITRFSGESDSFPSDKNYIQLRSNEVEFIAKKVINRIEEFKKIHAFYSNLKENKIPLKIMLELRFDKMDKKVYIHDLSYYIQGILFESYRNTQVEFSNDSNNHEIRVWQRHDYHCDSVEHIIEPQDIPPIFKNAPKVILKYLSYLKQDDPICRRNECASDKQRVNSLHEQNEEEIIFLSYAKGYKRLIGLFNDMIDFNKMQYIGPLRFYPKRNEDIKEVDINIDMPSSKESWYLLRKDEKIRETINRWLSDPLKLKTPYKIKMRTWYDGESLIKKLDYEKIKRAIDEIRSVEKEIQDLGLDKITLSDDKSYEKIFELAKELEKNQYKDYKDIFHYLFILHAYKDEKEEEKRRHSFSHYKVFEDIETKEELLFEDLRSNTLISNRDLGLGISQVLPILISTNTHSSTTIAIEQPELHLHPAVQAELADEFIRSYKENDNEFIIETHSEHLLLRIMRRMRHTAEGKISKDDVLALTPDDVCLLYVDSDDEKTFILELELDSDGTLLDPWPHGFFEEGYRERFA